MQNMSSAEDLSATLKLNGEQINLESRPLGGRHIRPSSRATLYSPNLSRPGSAVPALLLYNKNEYETKIITKRPSSADSPPLKGSNFPLRKCKMAAKFDLSEEDKASLPSTELFQCLLSEKINSWNKTDQKEDNKDNVMATEVEAKEDTISNEEVCSSDRSFGTRIQQFAKSEITPGLKSKPPLMPKKNCDNALKSTSDLTLHPSNKLKLDTLEEILNKCVDFSLKSNEFCNENDRESSDNDNQNVEHADKNVYTNIAKDLSVEDLEDKEEEKNNADIFQNWTHQTSSTASLDVLQSETKTDSMFASLRNTDLCSLRAEDFVDNFRSNEYEKYLDAEINLSNKEALNSKKQHEEESVKTCRETQAKPPKRITVKPSVAKVQQKGCLAEMTTPKKSILSKSKQKYVPKDECKVEQQTLNENVETWMSKKPCQSNYLEVLSKIEELESTSKSKLTDIPEHDVADDRKDVSPTSYQDIVSILEELEKEDRKSQQKMETMKEIVETELLASAKNDNFHKQRTKEEHSISPAKHCEEMILQARNSLSSSNFNEILSYLDSVDKSCMQSLNSAKKRYETVSKVTSFEIALDSIPRLEDLETRSKKDLAHFVIELSLRAKEKSSAIKILQNELYKLRDQLQNASKRNEFNIKEKLKNQKEEFEGIVKRQQKFIDQLIQEKRTLNERCEGLVLEMKALEDRFLSNMKAVEHRHHVELQKVKDMQAAGEKMRRERWIEGKTKKIKEMTVKGLGPELDSMAAKHEQDLCDLRSLHKRELEDLEMRAARKTQQQCETLREQYTAERERALAHERDVLRERYDKLVESEEKGYQEQRKRLLAEHARRIEECEIREAAAIAERDRAIKQARDEFEDKINSLIRRHKSEIKVIQETLQLEKEAWKTNVKKHNIQQLIEKEAIIRDQCKKERDRDIEVAIERLEKEATETKIQIEEAAENRIRRLKEKWEKEMMDLETSEENAKTKCNDLKGKLLEKEDTLVSMKSTLKHMEMELSRSKEVSEKLTKERSNMKEIVEEETYSQIESLKKEVLDLKEDKERQMQQLYSRVKVAVAHKDEILSELSRDHSALQEKCSFLENLLEQQQKKEYLLGNS